MNTPTHDISGLCLRSHQISLEKGWVTPEGDPRSYATITNLNHSELSEAMEEYRNHEPIDKIYYEVRGVKITKEQRQLSAEPPASNAGAFKPAGIPIELADFVIRVCQHVGTAGLGSELQELVETRVAPVYTTFDELLAELHLSVSLSYASTTNGVKSNGYLESLADAICEVFKFCATNKIDLWAAIDEKEAYNRTRPMRHGNKAC